MLAYWRRKDTSYRICLRRLLDMEATTTEAKGIFQKTVVLEEVDGKSNDVLDGEIFGGSAVLG